jgi:hypothetical protein
LLQSRLCKLESAFPSQWREATIRQGVAHPIVFDLRGWGRARLLALADVLTYKTEKKKGSPEIWMGGKLRDPKQYAPISSEFLAGPFLAGFGRLIAQPTGNGPRCDFIVALGNEYFGIEVKSLRRSVRAERAELEFARQNPHYSGVLPSQGAAMEAYEAARLRRRVRHAAIQLRASGKEHAKGRGFVGILLLDLVSNGYLTNQLDDLVDWLNHKRNFDWAQSIDTVLFIDHVPQTAGWGTIVRLAASRTDRFWSMALQKLGLPCREGHFHWGYKPKGGLCDYKFL